MTALKPQTRDQLKLCTTATLSTQLFKRGLRNVWIDGARLMSSAKGVMVGEAFTLRNIPCREDIDHVGVFDNPDHPQRKAIETAPAGSVFVNDCRRDTRAASGGGILLTRLAVRGVAGMVSDGCVRDATEIAVMDFPVYCAGAAAPLNIARHHAVDINVPVACGGVPVYPGDMIVGDGDGVIVIPAHLAEEVAAATVEQERFERFVMEEIRRGQPVIGTYPPNDATRARYLAWKDTPR
jgi:regulator of RNase E activity RraA